MIHLLKKELLTSPFMVWCSIGYIIVIYLVAFCTPLGDEYLYLFMFVAIGFPPIVFFMNLFFYTKLDGYKSELVLPVTKRDVVITRYLLYFLLVFVFALALGGILVLKLGFSVPTHELSSLLLATSQSLVFGGILLCFIFIFGHDKLKSFLVMTALGMVLMIRFMLQCLTYMLRLAELTDLYYHTYVFLILLMFSMLFYLVSCVTSIKVFDHKEF